MKERVSSSQVVRAVGEVFDARKEGAGFSLDGALLVERLARVLGITTIDFVKILNDLAEESAA